MIDIHVQNAPVSGKIAGLRHAPGQFLSALKAESAARNENVLIEFASSESPGEKIGVRLIAGVLARRIVPFVKNGDELQRGERISLIQFGSRCDLYLPVDYKIKVKLGDKVVGGRNDRGGEGIAHGNICPSTASAAKTAAAAEDIFSAEPDDGGEFVLRFCGVEQDQ